SVFVARPSSSQSKQRGGLSVMKIFQIAVFRFHVSRFLSVRGVSCLRFGACIFLALLAGR
ncbi:hypothetical protein, partial [Thiolapillus sp.]|uniref:hypothetical protein n=1 Tax=Thiolapillus sp. TaxID=2017437 RepID=UPI003AF44283